MRPRPTKVSEPGASNIYLYGKGVFTTVSIVDSEPLFWEKHWARLTENAARLGIDISDHREAYVRSAVTEAVRRDALVNGRVRISFFDRSSSELWGGQGNGTSLSILTGERRSVPGEFKLAISPCRINTTSPLTGIKSCNYLEPLMSLEEARKRGSHEAVRLNERGEVVSACMANVFWLQAGRLYTPSLKTGSLAGTTREFILESVDCEEVEAGIESLRAADEIFLSSAGLGVIQVAEFDGRRLRSGGHSVTSLLPF